MAMPSGNVVIADKMQLPSGGSVGGGGREVHHRQQWFPDERDGFISWLRGEFAAANAIIDSLCHHLRAIGEPGEYDFVYSCIQQRRCNWTPVLHMQQYFSIAEVTLALQQTQWRRQQRHFDQIKVMENDFKKPTPFGAGYRQGYRADTTKENHKSSSEPHRFDANLSVQSVNPDSNNTEEKPEKIETVKQGDMNKVVKTSDENGSAIAEDKKESNGVTISQVDCSSNGLDRPEVMKNEKSQSEALDGGCSSTSIGTSDALQQNDADSMPNQGERKNSIPVPKSFEGTEIFDGKTVNAVDGLKLYEELFDSSKISKVVSLVNELRATGRRGQLRGQMSYLVTKRPMKGRGREIIQLGLPIADASPEGEHMAVTSKDKKVEAIPGLLQDVIDHLVSLQIVNVKPDSCIVDFFNEGDYSQPFMCPPWFVRPVFILFLTECDMTFGRVIGIEHPGAYRGSLKLSLSAGSLLMLQGRSADFAKYAISSLRKQRILVTFAKSQPKKTISSESMRFSSSPAAPASPWAPSPSRPLNHVRHPAGPKNYGVIPTSGVLPAPAIRPQHLPPSNGMQSLFVPAQVAPAVPFAPLPPAPTGWSAVPPRHSPPRLPVPGTGVFLPPPGSGQSSAPQGTQQQTPATATEVNSAVEKASSEENEHVLDSSNSNSSASPEGELEGKAESSECN